jgi:hypothetical protein
VAVKRNDKELLHKIAARVGVNIPDVVQYDVPSLKDMAGTVQPKCTNWEHNKE